jgi:EAL and modified HD-GYP domain-containing signal transduction protein
MPQTLLGSLAFAYQPLWNKARELAGLRLQMQDVPGGMVDAPHLLQVLRSFWPHRNSSLILSPGSPGLLAALLESGQDYSPCLEIQHDWLEDPVIAQLAQAAHARGMHLVWRGPNSRMPAPELAQYFRRQLLSMDEQDTLQALRAALAKQSSDTLAVVPPTSPVQANHLYESVASRALADHCLDDAKVSELCGWPIEEMLHQYRHETPQPGQHAIQAVINAASNDASLDVLEGLLGQDPVLTYRFLVHVNSASNGLSRGIGSLRRGLMMLGFTALKAWCVQQMPSGNADRNLNPVRRDMVLRAHLTEFLLDAGGESDLRREIYMSGLFSQLDILLNEPLDQILGRLPLPDRIVEALCQGTGDYAPYLRLARTLQSMDATPVIAMCADFEMDLDDVNRALLRALGTTPFRPVKVQ